MSDAQTSRERDYAEQAVLGAIMLDRKARWAVLDMLDPGDFYNPKHETLAGVIRDLSMAGTEADPVMVIDEVLRRGLSTTLQPDWVHELTSVPPTTANATYYAEVVKRHAGLRRAKEAAEALGRAADSGADVEDVIAAARELLEGARDHRGDLSPIGSQFDYLVEELGNTPTYYPTRWPHLNNFLNGLMPGSVYVVAARPGAGKTIMGLQMAVDMVSHGPVAYFSLEMPRNQMLRRLLASESNVSLTTLSRHTLSPEDWQKVVPARSRIIDMPLYIDDRSDANLVQIEAYVRQLARGRERPSGVVVDYLQLIPATDSRKPRWEHMGDLTRGFKLLAKDLNIPIVLLCQLNRESEKNRRLPQLSDLRESGSIEQDADSVLMLQRRVDDNGDFIDEVDLVIAKNRHGQMGRIELGWEGKFARLVPIRFGTPAIDYRAMQAGEDA